MYSVAQLSDWIGGRVNGDAGVRIGADGAVVVDSRKVRHGDLFVALIGPNHDGHDFVPRAIESGAAACIVSDPNFGHERVPLVCVADTEIALGNLARYWRHRFHLPLAAITGSCGKTTTKEMVRTILEAHHAPLATTGNLNNHIGLPLTLMNLRPEHRTCVVEMGINRPGEIDPLCAVADPDIGLITGVGQAHLAGLKSSAGVAEEKGRLFAHVAAKGGTLVVNLDDDRVIAEAASQTGNVAGFCDSDHVFTYSTRPNVHADLCLTLDSDRPSDADGPGPAPVGIIIDLLGERHRGELFSAAPHQLINGAAAAALSHVLGATPKDMIRGLSAFSPPAMRGREIALKNGARIIDDSYNANPESMLAALMALSATPVTGHRIAVLGDMLELGNEAVALHRQMGERVAAMGIDRLICVGELTSNTALGAEGFATQVAHVTTASEALTHVREMASGDLLLVKGSRGLAMETLVNALILRDAETNADAHSDDGGRGEA